MYKTTISNNYVFNTAVFFLTFVSYLLCVFFFITFNKLEIILKENTWANILVMIGY